MKTRIIATVGPATGSQKTLREMMREGVRVFRFNFSHGTMRDHTRLLERVRRAQANTKRKIDVLQDLAGPRIRTGRLGGGKPLQLQRGQRFAFYRDPEPGTARGVSLDYPGAFDQIRRGQMIYIDDGNLHFQVRKSLPNRLESIVVQEGRLGQRKGVNIPGVALAFPQISAKDLGDLEFAIEHRVDYVAQSFVRNATDVLAVRRRLAFALPSCRVIAKIESREGVRNLAGILQSADGIMVARGDLGISIPVYELPLLQKWIIAACNHFGKIVITATQMLENMIEHPNPTRAEVSDVANAVLDGSDFVMLSGETATGRDPVAAVRMMRTIVDYTERHAPYRGVRRTRR